MFSAFGFPAHFQLIPVVSVLTELTNSPNFFFCCFHYISWNMKLRKCCNHFYFHRNQRLTTEEGNSIINTAPCFWAENFTYLACSLLSLYFLLREFRTLWTYCQKQQNKRVGSVCCDYRAGRKTSWFHKACQSLVPTHCQKSHAETRGVQQVTHLLQPQNSSILTSSAFMGGSTNTSPAYLRWFKEIFMGLHLSININN